MAAGDRGILDYEIQKTPISIFTFATTGLSPGGDRVVEVSVLRSDPGIEPRIVFDTLVNPNRSVAGTEIHGITDFDVEDAPTFDEIAGEFLKAISDSVVAAYNVFFEIRFLETELRNLKIHKLPPHFCLMNLKPMLGLGKKQSFESACREFGIDDSVRSVSAQETIARGELLRYYLEVLKEKNLRKFSDLLKLEEFDFLKSFSNPPFKVSEALQFGNSGRLKSRFFESAGGEEIELLTIEEPEDDQKHLMTYWDALKTALADLIIDPEEFDYLSELKRDLGLPDERIRVLHARAFVSLINEYIDDQWLDDDERLNLQRLHHCLSTLGWAPGE
ncbi:MAG: 3'-5' exonuclease [Planctomycetota bacterium]|jgi:DNA polymerase-3 subunit epsilon